MLFDPDLVYIAAGHVSVAGHPEEGGNGLSRPGGNLGFRI